MDFSEKILLLRENNLFQIDEKVNARKIHKKYVGYYRVLSGGERRCSGIRPGIIHGIMALQTFFVGVCLCFSANNLEDTEDISAIIFLFL